MLSQPNQPFNCNSGRVLQGGTCMPLKWKMAIACLETALRHILLPLYVLQICHRCAMHCSLQLLQCSCCNKIVAVTSLQCNCYSAIDASQSAVPCAVVLKHIGLYTFAKGFLSYICCGVSCKLQLNCLFDCCASLLVAWVLRIAWVALSCIDHVCNFELLFWPPGFGWVKISNSCPSRSCSCIKAHHNVKSSCWSYSYNRSLLNFCIW